MSAHSRVAVIAATRRAHSPYRRDSYREPLAAPRLTLNTKIVLKLIKLKFKILRVLRAWKKPTANRAIRRIVRKASVQANNKADPHLAKRV